MQIPLTEDNETNRCMYKGSESVQKLCKNNDR